MAKPRGLEVYTVRSLSVPVEMTVKVMQTLTQQSPLVSNDCCSEVSSTETVIPPQYERTDGGHAPPHFNTTENRTNVCEVCES